MCRSGSSLLAEVLSAHPSTSYYFEPLWQHQLSCESMMTNTKMVTDMEAIVGGLLNCYLPTVNQLKKEKIAEKLGIIRNPYEFYEDSHSGKNR